MSFKSFLVVASLAVSVLIGLVIVRGSAAQGAGVTGAATGPKVVKIGLSLDTLKEARWAKDRDAFVARAKELGAEVTVLSANSDDTRQVADVESLITSKVDVIVIVPHDGKAMAKGVEVAGRAGIPVIAYDRIITDSALDLYMTFDNEHVGELQGQIHPREAADHRSRSGSSASTAPGPTTTRSCSRMAKTKRSKTRSRRVSSKWCTKIGRTTGSRTTPNAS